MSVSEEIYEYHNNTLGVQGRFLFSGKNAHINSLCLITYWGFAKKIDREQITKLRAQAPGSPMLVSFDSLPQRWQELIVMSFGKAKAQVRKSFFEKNYTRDMEAFDFYSQYKFKDGISLTPEQINEYTDNASVLNAVGRVYRQRKAFIKELRGSGQTIWQTIANEAIQFKNIIPHDLPESDRRLRERYNMYKKEGYSCLIHKNIGKANALIVKDEYEELLNNLFTGIDYKPSYAEVSKLYNGFISGYVEVVNEESGEIYNPADFKKLSMATVWNHLSKWENKIGNELSRSGDRQKYMQKFKPYHKLIQPELASSLISVDDRQPPFIYNSNNDRVWFYNGVDLGSEALTCWVYGKDKKGIILDFYRQMVRNYAMWSLRLPAELEGELNLNASFQDTFLKEGNMFQYVRIEANNARGKRVERYWRDLRYGIENKHLGWIPRPNALSEANQKRTDKNIIIPYDEIVQQCLYDIQTWNNSEHSKIKGMSRWDVFLATQNPNLRPTNYHGILPYLGYKVRTSVNAGIINFRNDRFLLGIDGILCTGDNLINMMMLVEGKDIDIFYLDDNFGGVLKAHIYSKGRFICEAVPMPGYQRAKIEQTKEDLLNRELMSKYVTTIESFGNRQRKNLNKLTVIDNRPVTVNNNFSIMGLNGYTPSTEPAKVLAGLDDEVETVFNQHLNANQKSFNKSLRNSF